MILSKDDVHGTWTIAAGTFYGSLEVSPSGTYHLSCLNPGPSKFGEMIEAHWGSWIFGRLPDSNPELFLNLTLTGAYPGIAKDRICWPSEGETDVLILLSFIRPDLIFASGTAGEQNFWGLMEKISEAGQGETPATAAHGPPPARAEAKAPARRPEAPDAGPVATPPPQAAAAKEPQPDAKEALERERKELAAAAEIQKVQAALELEKARAESARQDQELELRKQRRLIEIERQRKEMAEQNELRRIQAQMKAETEATTLGIQQMQNAAQAKRFETWQEMNNRQRDATQKSVDAFIRTIR